MLFNHPTALDQNAVLHWRDLCANGLSVQRYASHASTLEYLAPSSFLLGVLPAGTTRRGIDAHFDACIAEVDLSAIFTLIAAAEARIRLDARTRAQKTANSLAKRLALLQSHAAHDWEVPLYEGGIIDAWKDYAATLKTMRQQDRDRILTGIGGLKDALRVRHWLAHGRYWTLKKNLASYPPAAVARTIGTLYNALNEIAALGRLSPFI
ncbi:hypothetical protein [Rugamonas sp.]|uniref:hypothetical protein n=1 Tax=Rugamonas sp. TaxID=1926287 RepID=UPI0025E4C463|nr:hypothetical protein [Rugamonas sp.]